jgi:hypothetical protein
MQHALGRQKCIQIPGQKTEGHIGTGERILWKGMLMNWNARVWTGLSWLRIKSISDIRIKKQDGNFSAS